MKLMKEHAMEEKKKQINDILAKYVTPHLVQHGGGLYLADIQDDIAYIRFTGGCSGCPSAKYTLESIVKEELFRYTDLVKDVKMAEGVSDELYDIAKRILRKKEGDKSCETESAEEAR